MGHLSRGGMGRPIPPLGIRACHEPLKLSDNSATMSIIVSKNRINKQYSINEMLIMHFRNNYIGLCLYTGTVLLHPKAENLTKHFLFSFNESIKVNY